MRKNVLEAQAFWAKKQVAQSLFQARPKTRKKTKTKSSTTFSPTLDLFLFSFCFPFPQGVEFFIYFFLVKNVQKKNNKNIRIYKWMGTWGTVYVYGEYNGINVNKTGNQQEKLYFPERQEGIRKKEKIQILKRTHIIFIRYKKELIFIII